MSINALMVSYKLGTSSTYTYWLASNSSINNWSPTGSGVVIDSSNNVYTIGKVGATIFVIKFDQYGNILWQYKLSTSGGLTDAAGLSITIDSSDNIYVTGFIYDGEYYSTIIKLNSSGTIQWQGGDNVSTKQTQNNGAVVTSAGDVWTVGFTEYSSPSIIGFVTKWTSSGTFSSKTSLSISTILCFENGIAIDGSNNLFVVGTAYYPQTRLILTKLSSTGTITWSVSLYIASFYVYGSGVEVDSSGNIYVVGYYYTFLIIAKYNTSGTLQWQRKIDGSQVDGRCIAISGSYVYVAGKNIIAKYNTSGTLQWQRKIDTIGILYGIKISSDGTKMVLSYDYGGVVLLPTDGTETGTHGSYTYSDPGYTESAGGLTSSAITVSTTGPTFTHSPPTLTSTAASTTVTLTQL